MQQTIANSRPSLAEEGDVDDSRAGCLIKGRRREVVGNCLSGFLRAAFLSTAWALGATAHLPLQMSPSCPFSPRQDSSQCLCLRLTSVDLLDPVVAAVHVLWLAFILGNKRFRGAEGAYIVYNCLSMHTSSCPPSLPPAPCQAITCSHSFLSLSTLARAWFRMNFCSLASIPHVRV